jgi:hypothetical protein
MSRTSWWKNGHQANECLEDENDKKKKAKEEPQKKMNRWELYVHV